MSVYWNSYTVSQCARHWENRDLRSKSLGERNTVSSLCSTFSATLYVVIIQLLFPSELSPAQESGSLQTTCSFFLTPVMLMSHCCHWEALTKAVGVCRRGERGPQCSHLQGSGMPLLSSRRGIPGNIPNSPADYPSEMLSGGWPMTPGPILKGRNG